MCVVVCVCVCECVSIYLSVFGVLCTQAFVYFLDKPTVKQFSLRCLWKEFVSQQEKKPFSICPCQINISYFKSSRLWAAMILSEYCLALVLCYPAQSSSFVCLYPFSPMKGNWKQRLQLVRQLDSCFVSSTHPLSHSLIAILSSSIAHLPFTCSLMVFCFFFPLSLGVAFCVKPRLSDIRCNVFFFSRHRKAFIIPSLFLLFICYLSLLLHLSFRLSLCLFISFNRSPPRHPSQGRLVWPVCAHTHTHA